jgi:hypothetical protein
MTLNDLLFDPEFNSKLETSFAVVPQTATLADVKRAMESTVVSRYVRDARGYKDGAGHCLGHERDR